MHDSTTRNNELLHKGIEESWAHFLLRKRVPIDYFSPCIEECLSAAVGCIFSQVGVWLFLLSLFSVCENAKREREGCNGVFGLRDHRRRGQFRKTRHFQEAILVIFAISLFNWHATFQGVFNWKDEGSNCTMEVLRREKKKADARRR